VGRLAAGRLSRQVVVRDAEKASEAWGVEWRSAAYRGSLLVNLVNYTQKPITVRLEVPKGELRNVEKMTNLITGKRVQLPVCLDPLAPVLLRID
jgi:hypothetical protein